MNNTEQKYLLALKNVNGVGDILARQLISSFGSAQSVFEMSIGQLLKIPKITEKVAKEIVACNGLEWAEKEMEWCDKQNIDIIPFDSPFYPKRLSECHDAPLVLFVKGKADLNGPKMISIVGTRKNTDYGRIVTEKIVENLQALGVTIVSGLALGIDGIAHRKALDCNLPTIAVLGHPLNQIYPSRHQSLAQKILDDGAWISELSRQSPLDRNNFPMRNRIVAGMTDATILIESDVQGGSMITAELAHSYGRDVLAVPGKWTDATSQGPLKLIKSMKAQLLTKPDDVAETLGWMIGKQLLMDDIYDRKNKYQHLDEKEMKIIGYLDEKTPSTIDNIHYGTEIPINELSAILLSLEFKGVVESLPGKRFQMK